MLPRPDGPKRGDDEDKANLPPEVMFHLFFQTSLNPDPEVFRGAVSLDGTSVAAVDTSLLLALRTTVNAALGDAISAGTSVLQIDRCHFDFIDSDIENA